MKTLAALLCLIVTALPTLAEVQTKEVVYQDGDTTLTGYLAWDSTLAPQLGEGQPDLGALKLPGVLIVHQWMGLTDYEKGRAKQLAEMGYVAFALDIYGSDHNPTDFQSAGAASGRFKGDRELFRKRLNLGLEQLRLQAKDMLDPQNVAAIGYCFGGTGVLELARSGADIAGVVSFHGGLDSTHPEDGKNIKCPILICHGEADPFVPQEGIDAMAKEFNAAEVDWQMISYSGVVHSFTQPMAGNEPEKGYAYNEKADKRSWKHMKVFFSEVLGKPKTAKQ